MTDYQNDPGNRPNPYNNYPGYGGNTPENRGANGLATGGNGPTQSSGYQPNSGGPNPANGSYGQDPNQWGQPVGDYGRQPGQSANPQHDGRPNVPSSPGGNYSSNPGQQENRSYQPGPGSYGGPVSGGPAPTKQGGSKVLIGVIAGVAILALAAVIYFFVIKGGGSKATPEGTIKVLEQAMNDMDYDKLLTCLDQTNKNEMEQGANNELAYHGFSKEVFTVYGPQMKSAGGWPTFEINIEDIRPENYTEKDRIYVDVTVNIKLMEQMDPVSEYMHLPMIFQDGQWLITSDGEFNY